MINLFLNAFYILPHKQNRVLIQHILNEEMYYMKMLIDDKKYTVRRHPCPKNNAKTAWEPVEHSEKASGIWSQTTCLRLNSASNTSSWYDEKTLCVCVNKEQWGVSFD